MADFLANEGEPLGAPLSGATLGWRYWSVAAALVAVLCGLAVALEVTLRHDARAVRDAETRHALEDLAQGVEAILAREIVVATDAAAAAAADPEITQDAFAAAAQRALGGGALASHVALARDMTVTHVYPLAGNELALGFDYKSSPEQWPGVRAAALRRDAVVDGPYTLIQGGEALLVRVPVFVADEASGEPRLWGMASSVVPLAAVRAALGELADGFDDVRIVAETISGARLVFAQDEAAPVAPVVHALALPGATWRISGERGFAPPISRASAWLARSIFALFAVGVVVAASRRRWDRRRARTAERRLRHFFDCAWDSMFVIDADTGRILDINARGAERHGYAREELVGQFAAVVSAHPENADGQLRRCREAGEGVTIRTVSEHRAKDGAVFPVEVWLSVTRIDGRLCLLAACRDIGEQRATMERLEATAKRLELALELGKAAAWEYDVATGAYSASGVFFEEAGARGQLANDPSDILKLVHPDDLDTVNAAWEAHAAGGPPLDIDHRLNEPGEARWVRAYARQTLDENGELVRLGGIVFDITERKRQERALEQALDEAKSASRAKSDFLAMMSHELRTPMNAVLGGVELLRREGPTDRQRAHLDLIANAGRGLMVILDDFLDLSKIEAGKLKMCVEPVDLGSMFAHVHQLWTPRAKDKGIDLQLDLADDVTGSVLTDPTRAQQIFSNLLSNAIKFTAKGCVRLAARLEAGAEGGQNLVVVVSDTGPGIPLDVQPRLFDAFEQADSSVARRFGGTGLGLAISRRLARALGGDITVKSEPGRGAAFTVTLDAPSTDAAEAEVEHEAAAAHGPLHILCVDDNETNRVVASALLEALGHEVTLAEGGVDALLKLAAAPYDLVLMDVVMPDLEGPEVTRRLRASAGPNRAAPVIALTANVAPDQVATYAAAGMDGHVAKPMDVRLLAEEMARVVAQARDEGAASATASGAA